MAASHFAARNPICASTVVYAGDFALLSATNGDSPKWRARSAPNQPESRCAVSLKSVTLVGLLGI